MPNPSDPILEFQCPKCAKRLKAGSQIAGKKVKCPKCGQPVKVPGSQPAAQPADDNWLSLDTPAIEDLSSRERAAAEVKAQRSAFRASQHKLRDKSPLTSEAVAPVAAVPHSRRQSAGAAFAEAAEVLDDEFTLEPLVDRKSPGSSRPEMPAPSSRSAGTEDAGGAAEAEQPAAELPAAELPAARKTSVFDDDLPELAELRPPAPTPSSLGKPGAGDDLGDLDDLIPNLDEGLLEQGRRGGASAGQAGGGALGSLLDDPDTTDHEYRISCKICGTAQYVRLSATGMKIKCPDCLSDFRVPPPPAGWLPQSKKKKLQLSDEDVPLAAVEEYQQQKTLNGQRTRASTMMEKAQREISDDELDRLYDGDFDTAGFVRRTFGFLTDPVAVSFVVGYGIVFACVFGLAQFGLNSADAGFGRGALLLGMIGAPLIGVLFGMPMLSCALTLLESVANRQPKVADWPGFNIFDNFGDLLAIAAALLGALLPGYLLGSWIGGDEPAAGRMQITGMMLTIYLLFPIFLLAILDNGSVLQPISVAVLGSFKPAAEAWGGYYLKTLIAFAVTLLLWYVVLGEGKSAYLAAVGGFVLPGLVFFTFQQLGALADGISEHLTVEFTPPGKDEGTDETSEGAETQQQQR